MPRTTCDPPTYCGSCGGLFGVEVSLQHACPFEDDDEPSFCEICGAELTEHGSCDNDHDDEAIQ